MSEQDTIHAEVNMTSPDEAGGASPDSAHSELSVSTTGQIPSPQSNWCWPAKTLLLGGTPIGNLGDATPRLHQAFEQADIIAAEDTRRAGLLRANLGIERKARLISCHEHNERERAGELLEAVEQGQRVLLVSDAGMPTVSDPGFALARAAIERGLNVSVLPGPSAPLAALAISGLPSDRFCFEGFLPRKEQALHAALAELATEKRTMIFFESPRRLQATLTAMASEFGAQRPVCVCRELTKTYEEAWRGSLAEVLAVANEREVLGEIVVVVGGAPKEMGALSLDQASEQAAQLMQIQGLKPKVAAKQIAATCEFSARDIYDALQRRPD